MSNSSPISHLMDFNPSIVFLLLPLCHSRLPFSLLRGKKKKPKDSVAEKRWRGGDQDD